MTDSYTTYQNSSHICSGNKPEDACKIFVGGLSWDTTQEKLNAYFSRFGEVVDCILMMDTATKRSRGFGFVTYKDPSSVSHVLDGGPHVLDNKSIDPKAAVPRFPPGTSPKVQTQPTTPIAVRRCNKIFVGGIGQATEEDLRSYFQSYGHVTDVTIMMDKNTGRPRGFAFVGFENIESSEQTAQLRYHSIKGKRVEVKVAQPRDTKSIDYIDDIPRTSDGENFGLMSYHLPIFSETNGIGSSTGSGTVTNGLDGPKNTRTPENPINQYTRNTIVQLLNNIWS